MVDEANQTSNEVSGELANVFPYCKSYGRCMINTVLDAEDGGKSLIGKTLRVGGWIRTGRSGGAGAFAFVELNDGSCFDSLQVVVQQAVIQDSQVIEDIKQLQHTGASLLVEGVLSETPEGVKQAVELQASKLVFYSGCDAATYPLAKGKPSFEFLRTKMHLRARTNTIGATVRIRNALTMATHDFFQQNGFQYIHTPILTASDCEGAGEMFQVTTLLSTVEEQEAKPQVSDDDLAAIRAKVSDQGGAVKQAKAAAAANKEDKDLAATAKEAVNQLLALKGELAEAEEKASYKNGFKRDESGKIDFKEDFFAKKSFLTVSGQLNGEYMACSMSNIYTMGPTFRAENSRTTRHLAEFWMIEPEMVFCDLDDNMSCAEDYVKFCCKRLLDTCRGDLDFMQKRIDKTCIKRLEQVVSSPFIRLSYTKAIEQLKEAVGKGKKFEYPVEWGIDLQTEHERYISEELYNSPVILYDYPKDIKAFYMKRNADGKTVAAMDVLVPKIGELIGGSQREDNYDTLLEALNQQGMEVEDYEYYLDLRKYGSVPHSGFGVGLERLVMFATGLENIREVIPFPRWPGNIEG